MAMPRSSKRQVMLKVMPTNSITNISQTTVNTINLRNKWFGIAILCIE